VEILGKKPGHRMIEDIVAFFLGEREKVRAWTFEPYLQLPTDEKEK